MNRQQMFQLFAQRMNLSPEEATALQSGDYERALAGRAQSDPVMQAMLGMMQSRRAEAAEAAEPEPPPRRPQRSTDELDDLQDALHAARTMLRYLAQILGACRCWGKNPRCSRCEGEGVPGSQASADPQTLLAWLRPSLRALGYQIVPLADPGLSPHP